MELLNKFFKKTNNEDNKKLIGEKYKDEINTILYVMDNLGLLDTKKIEKKIEDQGVKYDKSILNRFMISINEEDISELKKYFNTATMGYGENKLRKIKNRLIELAEIREQSGSNRLEVIEELITEGRIEIENYKKTISEFNALIKDLSNKYEKKSDLLVMIDYWYNNYREEKLGYPVDIEKRVSTMSRSLENLPYGGYGSSQIEEFNNDAKKAIEEGKANNENPNNILNTIINKIYTPKRKRYEADVVSLRKKIELITQSKSLTNEQKKQNIAKTIEEFNKMYGHQLEIETPKAPKQEKPLDNSIFLVEVNVEKLMNLNGNGYGAEAIAKYRDRCRKIMSSNISEDEKYIQINKHAELLIDNYNSNVELFNTWKESQLVGLSEEEKEKKAIELDKIIKHMLTLSPEALNDYFLEDSRIKKEQADKHNYELAFRYLAKKDSKDDNEYNDKIRQLASGKQLYNQEQIEEAYTELLIKSLTEDKEDDNFIDAVAYIDSTLAHQIYTIENTQSIKI